MGDEDMEFFKERLEVPAGSGPWEHMMTKDFGTFTYEAWRRTLAVSACTAAPKPVKVTSYLPVYQMFG